MIDLLVVKKDLLRYVQDVWAVRGMGRDLSDPYVVLCKARLVGELNGRTEVKVRVEELKN